MKIIIISIACVLFFAVAQAQSFRLDDLLKETYSKKSDLPVIEGQELDYIVPRFVSFIDTNNIITSQYGFKLSYFADDSTFETHLKHVHNVTLIYIYYDTIGNDQMMLTVEVSKTTDDQYLGPYKFLTFVDKRSIKLRYDKSESKWKYDSLIRLYDEPRVGNR